MRQKILNIIYEWLILSPFFDQLNEKEKSYMDSMQEVAKEHIAKNCTDELNEVFGKWVVSWELWPLQ